jgi:hypothetical protein
MYRTLQQMNGRKEKQRKEGKEIENVYC